MDAKDPRSPDHLPTVTPIHTSTLPGDHLARLAEARSRGGSFLWMGLAGAFAWWIAAFGGAAALIGLDQLSAYFSSVIGAGAVALAIPGLMLIMAGLLARENSRAASTNAVVLEAAARLLAPMEKTGSESRTFADQMRQSASDVDRAMAHALSSMKAMAGEIADERQRLESVSYVAADNAKELSQRLGDERKALETLAADIHKQTQMMGEAIPRQAAQMRDSARAAAADIAQADQALEIRLENLDTASSRLTDKVSSLDTLSIDAAKRSEALIFAVTRMEEKLEQSRKMVEQALRAGEMVAASASTTGDRLTEAVNSALDHARAASRDIQAEALEAAERAAKSLAQLKTAGRDAAEAVRATRNEGENGLRPSAPAIPAAREPEPEAPRPAARPDAARAEETPARSSWRTSFTRPQSQPRLEDDDVFDDEPAPTPAPARPSAASPDQRQNDDGDLFDGAEPEATRAPETDRPRAVQTSAVNENEAGTPSAAEDRQPVPFMRRRNDRPPPYLKPVGGSQAVNLAPAEDEDEDSETAFADPEAETDIEASPAARIEAEPEATPQPAPARRQDSQQWGDIIADMERDEQVILPREETAEEVIHRLMESGIQLGEVFRPRDKKRIAQAARKGEGYRRKAILDAAARQVPRVQKRLDTDRQLMHMAREFLAMEEPDALMALDKTCHSSKNASARLSAFLLIDAALG